MAKPPRGTCVLCRRRPRVFPLAFCHGCIRIHLDPEYVSPPPDSDFARERRRRVDWYAERAARGLPLFDVPPPEPTRTHLDAAASAG